MDFSRLLIRWFKIYLRRTEQYPSLSNRILYRYRIQPIKASVTLGGKTEKEQMNIVSDPLLSLSLSLSLTESLVNLVLQV